MNKLDPVDKQERRIEELTAILAPAVRAAVMYLFEEEMLRLRMQNQQSPTGDERMMTVREAAQFLGVTEMGIRTWVKKGELIPRRVGADMRFLRSELLKWTEEQETKRAKKSAR